MNFAKEKIRVMSEKLKELETTDTREIGFLYHDCPEYKITNTPPPENSDWHTIPKNYRFSGIDKHFWVHFKIDRVEPSCGKELRLLVKTGFENTWASTNPQFTVFLNGETAQALDTNHCWLPLEFDTDYDVYIYAYTGMEGQPFDFIPQLITVDKEIESLYYDITVPFKCMELLDENSYDYIKIRDCLDKALINLDLREVYSDSFYQSIRKTAKYLKTELYGRLCGKSEGVVCCIGHTHIDVAWLWTVAQTREKAQRSFSTVINMMKHYDDYKFMSSQPQLYQFVKENDPVLYSKIKERAAECRWEVEGAMWLEADTNLASGESLVRQILYGKRFMKEEFGVNSTILWLPDVFGYSAALPQILRKSGITKFFTAKMSWSESNSMPNDTFIWEGIDGSRVFASIVLSYINILDPEHLFYRWRDFKNKSLTDNILLTFGYGDGGGGPTYEMMENYERLKYGLPGMPRAEICTAGEYFRKVEADFEKNTAELVSTPKWVGEMYLEMHRGTYTSMAKNKKNNRKSELLYLEAETASVLDMALLGGEYPEDTLRKNQTNILLNQFHDIIPGSSIKEVYDVTDIEYERILREGNEILKSKLENLKSNLKADGGIFVYNPTPFEISDFVETDGKKFYAENIPAHGWSVIKDEPCEFHIKVGGYELENDVIRVKFNEKYHIVSVFDKIRRREVISENSEANRIEIFEDYPKKYDAWEITDYYKQKMWIADDVSGVEMLGNGVKITRKYGHSEIVQEISLRPHSSRIDFITEVDWHEDHVLMKAAFPVDIRSTFATYDIQFGNIERPTHRNTSWDAAKFEVCAHKWADLSEGGYGVSLLNDCKYGYSIEDNIIKISLLKAATYPNPEADRGKNSFTYSLYPHAGDFREGKTVREAYLLNMPLIAGKTGKTEGVLPSCGFILKSDCENVLVETVKKAESGNGIIARLYEAHNRKSTVKITAGFDFSEIYLCDLMENNIKKLPFCGREVEIPVKNFEIITLKFI